MDQSTSEFLANLLSRFYSNGYLDSPPPQSDFENFTLFAIGGSLIFDYMDDTLKFNELDYQHLPDNTKYQCLIEAMYLYLDGYNGLITSNALLQRVAERRGHKSESASDHCDHKIYFAEENSLLDETETVGELQPVQYEEQEIIYATDEAELIDTVLQYQNDSTSNICIFSNTTLEKRSIISRCTERRFSLPTQQELPMDLDFRFVMLQASTCSNSVNSRKYKLLQSLLLSIDITHDITDLLYSDATVWIIRCIRKRVLSLYHLSLIRAFLNVPKLRYVRWTISESISHSRFGRRRRLISSWRIGQ